MANNIKKLDSIIKELIINESFKNSKLNFEKDYDEYFINMSNNLDVIFEQFQNRFYSEFYMKFNNNFIPTEMFLEKVKIKMGHSEKIDYVNGYNDALNHFKELLLEQRILIINAIEQAFTLSNADKQR